MNTVDLEQHLFQELANKEAYLERIRANLHLVFSEYTTPSVLNCLHAILKQGPCEGLEAKNALIDSIAMIMSAYGERWHQADVRIALASIMEDHRNRIVWTSSMGLALASKE